MAENTVTEAELEALRRENERLRQQQEAQGHGIRKTFVVILLVLGVLLTIPGILAPWLRTQLLDTDRFVESISGVIEEPEVVDVISTRITEQIFQEVDIDSLLADTLPPRLSFAAGPIGSQIQSTTKDLVVRALESDEFQQLWTEAITKAHATVVTFLKTGESAVLSVNADNQLVVDLGPIVTQVRAKLVAEGLTFIDRVPQLVSSHEIAIADASFLVDARQLVRLLQIAGLVFPLLAIACLLGAVLLSRNHRQTLLWAGLCLAVGALLTGVGLAFGRTAFLNGVTATIPVDAATVLFNDYVQYLRNTIRVVFVIGILIAVFVWASGSTSSATKMRQTLGGALSGAGGKSGLAAGPAVTWINEHRKAILISLAALGGIVLVAVDAPTPKLVIALVLIWLAFVAVLQVLAGARPADAAIEAESESSSA